VGARVPALLLIVAIAATPAAAQQHIVPGAGAGAGIARGGSTGFVPGASVPTVRSAPVIRSAPPPVTPSVPRVTSSAAASVHALPPSIIQAAPKGVGVLGPSVHVVRPGGILPLVPPQPTRDATREARRPEPDIDNRTPLGRERANRNFVIRGGNNLGRVTMLRNDAFASASRRDPATRAVASATFRGRLVRHRWHDHDDGWFWRHRRPIIVIGWFGPLFWPYAYGDLFDYTFSPYAYDAFWPYAFDDLYVGLFGPYSYEGRGASSGGSGRALRRPAGPEVCETQAAALTDWPIRQIAQTVQSDDDQQAALNDFRDATGKALDLLQSACPTDLPSTPTGRLAAMRKRVEAMLSALGFVRPALERFYGLLSDEQKARFNLIAPEVQPARQRSSDPAQLCTEPAAKATEMPTARIERALRLSDEQRNALAALNEAARKTADLLEAKCPADETLTPPGRVAAMQQRLEAVLGAIKILQPALEDFYAKLTDEQKARFNQLDAGQS
jgi:LTXXQ motif family protein